mmetsp:Transcript_2470/g.9008  ORF Transcript_2470/g.9008 Transcript_2470/m.9008 type:complete len:218 (-) Transcript_2470:554-1207(-)
MVAVLLDGCGRGRLIHVPGQQRARPARVADQGSSLVVRLAQVELHLHRLLLAHLRRRRGGRAPRAAERQSVARARVERRLGLGGGEVGGRQSRLVAVGGRLLRRGVGGLDLHDLARDERVQRARHHLDDFRVLQLGEQHRRAREEVVAGEDGDLVGVHFVDGVASPTRIRVVQDVVMDQGSDMDHLRDLPEARLPPGHERARLGRRRGVGRKCRRHG